jgi:hypothetical protein
MAGSHKKKWNPSSSQSAEASQPAPGDTPSGSTPPGPLKIRVTDSIGMAACFPDRPKAWQIYRDGAVAT